MSASLSHLPYQLRATRALIKFIRDHKGGVHQELEACLAALERKDLPAATQAARKVKVHGMGGITDWFPPTVFAHETEEYVWAELEALAGHWAHMMSLAFDDKRKA